MWGAQVKLVLEIKRHWVAVNEMTPSESDLKMKKDAVSMVAAIAGTSKLGAVSVMPLNGRVINQNMAASFILAALGEKITSEMYFMDYPPTMLRHLRLTYNVKCGASIGASNRECMGLYLGGDDSMVNHIKTKRRVFDELQEQHVHVPDEERRQNSMQSLGPAWNEFVGVLESCARFEATLQRAHVEAVRRDQQKGRRSTSIDTAGNKASAAFHTEQKPGRRFTKSKTDSDMSKAKCYNRNHLGHFARSCTNDFTKKETSSTAILVEDAETSCERVWIVDSGATSHMTGHLKALIDVHSLDKLCLLTVASEEMMMATSIGKAMLQRDGSGVYALQYVLYVKGLARNLVSVAAASRNGMEIIFKEESSVIRSDAGTTLEASRANHHVYVVSALSEPIIGSAMIMTEMSHVET
uniref:Retrovirus-related Pol polyprotein from transposon TNT 1-94-like beta-barrel domain-containing protein n=1 Tax=Peronospora matthiolae TaxID=2874970 RepID=A0AAV1TM79_9STRA